MAAFRRLFSRAFSAPSAPVFHSRFGEDVSMTAAMFFIVSSSYAFGTLLGEVFSKKTPFEDEVKTKMDTMGTTVASIGTTVTSIGTSLASIERTTTAIYDLAKKSDLDKKSK